MYLMFKIIDVLHVNAKNLRIVEIFTGLQNAYCMLILPDLYLVNNDYVRWKKSNEESWISIANDIAYFLQLCNDILA